MAELVRMITSNGQIMASAVNSTDIVAKAEQIHSTSAVVTAAFGRLLTAASLMGNQLKGSKNSITLRVAGGGPVGSIIAVSDAAGNVRGYVTNPVVELPLNSKGKLDVGSAVGKNGTLTVIKDLGLKEPYNGSIPLTSGEIAEDITAYFALSEQIPTVCALGVLVNPDLSVNCAGGYIIQLLPAAEDKTIELLEDGIKNMPPVTEMLAKGISVTEILNKALKNFETEVLYTTDVAYKCYCSRQRVERALITMDRSELQSMADEMEIAEVKCNFCDKVYKFTKSDLKKLEKN